MSGNKDVTKEQRTDEVTKRLDEIEHGLKVELEESRKQVEELSQKLSSLSNKNNVGEETIDVERRSANSITLPIIEGAPVIKSEIVAVKDIEGIEMLAKVENADGKKFTVPFGCNVKNVDFTQDNTKDLYQTSYENLESGTFELVDIVDLTGASKVEKGKIVSVGTPVDEVDRSSGVPVLTGRKIKAVVRRDVREYTIQYNGKKFRFTGDDLANIRI